MDAVGTKNIVLSVPVDLLERLSKYAQKDCDKKFLMLTGIQDYIAKREARTARADEQKRKRAKS